MWRRGPLRLLLASTLAAAQFEEEEKPYRGQLIGSINSFHHQVLGPFLGSRPAPALCSMLILPVISCALRHCQF
jgi:hypothetical protein